MSNVSVSLDALPKVSDVDSAPDPTAIEYEREAVFLFRLPE